MKSLVIVSAALTAFAVGAGESVTKNITLDPSASILWKTATAFPAKVSLLWPAGAASATLAMDPGTTVDITDTSLTSYALPQTAAPANETDETVVQLTLTYKDANGAAIQVQTATLGFVCGTAATSDIAWRTPGTRSWSKRKANAPVIPVPADVTALSLDDGALDVSDAPTWARLAGEGLEHELAWTKGGADGSQSYRISGGSLIIVR